MFVGTGSRATGNAPGTAVLRPPVGGQRTKRTTQAEARLASEAACRHVQRRAGEAGGVERGRPTLPSAPSQALAEAARGVPCPRQPSHKRDHAEAHGPAMELRTLRVLHTDQNSQTGSGSEEFLAAARNAYRRYRVPAYPRTFVPEIMIE